jgi:hypothetical protein
MARKRFTTEEIIGLLREAKVRLSQGQTIGVVCRGLGISEQSYYRWRSTQRRCLKTASDEAALTVDIVRRATRYGRYGYRRIREMLVAEGWRVNLKRVYLIWRRRSVALARNREHRSRRQARSRLATLRCTWPIRTPASIGRGVNSDSVGGAASVGWLISYSLDS